MPGRLRFGEPSDVSRSDGPRLPAGRFLTQQIWGERFMETLPDGVLATMIQGELCFEGTYQEMLVRINHV